MITSETSPSPAPAVGGDLTIGAWPASGICKPFGDRIQRPGVANEDPEPLLGLGRGMVQRLGVQHPGADVLALQFGPELQQHRGSRFQHVAVLGKPFGKQHRLEMAGRVGQAHDAHLVAGLGAPFHSRDHGGSHLAGGRAGSHGAGKLRPGLHPQALERDGVVVERMAGEEEPDGIVFTPQPVGGQPRLDLRQHDGGGVGGAAEHVVLAHGGGLVAALAGRQYGFGAGEYPRPVGKSSVSNAPAAARLSITRLLTARGFTREAKSDSALNSPSLRASTISSTACAPTPLRAASA